MAEQRRVMQSTAGHGPTRRDRRRDTDAIDLTTEDRRLFDSLKAWRLAQSRLADVPAFVIFNDATLTEVARQRPSSRAALMSVPGIGAVKAERFGEQVLEIVRESS